MKPSRPSARTSFPHLDPRGKARMVDVSRKNLTRRIAVARGEIHLHSQTLTRIQENQVSKGDVFAVAKIAGILAAKRTSELVPLCHPLNLTNIEIAFRIRPLSKRSSQDIGIIQVESRVKCLGQTGVEMEALIAVAVACLTIYDMVKSTDRAAIITNIRLIEKRGGKSGAFKLTQ